MKCSHEAKPSHKKTLHQSVWVGFLASACLVVLAVVLGPADLTAQAQYPDEQVIPDHVDKYTKTNWTRDRRWPRGDCGDLTDAYGRPLTDCSVPWNEAQPNERGRSWLAYFDAHQSPTLNECAAVTTPGVLGDVRPFGFTFKTDSLIINYEHAGWVRTVCMDGRRHPPPDRPFSTRTRDSSLGG